MKDGKGIRPEVGQRVEITHWAEPVHNEWRPFLLPRTREGIYIGYRTKFNGRTEYDGGHRYFVQHEGVRVWMVVLNERENPVPVFPEHVFPVVD